MAKKRADHRGEGNRKEEPSKTCRLVIPAFFMPCRFVNVAPVLCNHAISIKIGF